MTTPSKSTPIKAVQAPTAAKPSPSPTPKPAEPETKATEATVTVDPAAEPFASSGVETTSSAIETGESEYIHYRVIDEHGTVYAGSADDLLDHPEAVRIRDRYARIINEAFGAIYIQSEKITRSGWKTIK